MAMRLTPNRRRGIEVLDGHDVDPQLRRRSHRDIQLSNTLFGGTHALMAELRDALPDLPRSATLLDVGTGVGDIPARATSVAAKRGPKDSPPYSESAPISLIRPSRLVMRRRATLPSGG